MWIVCSAEDSHETLSLIFSEKQRKSIYECRLLQSWLALLGLSFVSIINLLVVSQHGQGELVHLQGI